jgi:sulfur carrier protein
MKLRLNGETIETADRQTLGGLLASLGIAADSQGVAVAVNDRVVPKRKWEGTALEPDDAVEIIHAVQGG